MGSVKPRLTRSYSSPLVDGLGCDLALTGVSMGLGPGPGLASASGHKLESSKSLQTSESVTSTGDRGGIVTFIVFLQLSNFFQSRKLPVICWTAPVMDVFLPTVKPQKLSRKSLCAKRHQDSQPPLPHSPHVTML